MLTVADGNPEMARAKVGASAHGQAILLDVNDEQQRSALVNKADVVISLLPPELHFKVATDCIKAEKHLLTASYIDSNMQMLASEARKKGLLFLCEMGLDPGIDHMSAMQLFDRIRSQNGQIREFRSHCGGLVAPESDNNPWHYKISWNPRNIVMAGKSGATFWENGQLQKLDYPSLFDPARTVEVPALGTLAWYPNRDSTGYASLYGLKDIPTFIRTTLRHPSFCFGWRNLIDLKLTDEHVRYNTDGLCLKDFFHQHLSRNGFSEWLDKQVTGRVEQTRELLLKLQELLEAENEVDDKIREKIQQFMMVDDQGRLNDVHLGDIKTRAAATVAGQMRDANLLLKQLLFLGMDDETTFINKGTCSAMDVLQFCLENKLALAPDDKDMIVMLHEINYSINGSDRSLKSSLIVKGTDRLHTAMAKTVGLPLGIAASLLLRGKIRSTGLHIPVLPEIYEPVLAELGQHGIQFHEEEITA
jgi:saccharopine dehydrogenase-like NADP-dependent oxidoreductase